MTTTLKMLLIAVSLMLATQVLAAKEELDAAPILYANYDIVECDDFDDPFEKVNRKIFVFNSVLDYIFLRPLARGYTVLVPEEGRDKIGNALNNTKVPLTMVNNALQGNGDNVLLSFWQFMINSTLGVAGFYDVAKKQGLHVDPQTFGSTLANYGIAPGPYIVLPFLGGTSMRDMWDPVVANNMLNPLQYHLGKGVKYSLTASNMIHSRAVILPFTDHIAKNSTDPYAAIRSSVFQNRHIQLKYPDGYKCDFNKKK